MFDEIKLNMFVELWMIPNLLSYMHIRAQSWHICAAFGNYSDGIVKLFF